MRSEEIVEGNNRKIKKMRVKRRNGGWSSIINRIGKGEDRRENEIKRRIKRRLKLIEKEIWILRKEGKVGKKIWNIEIREDGELKKK